jgi:hypothetical protein
MKTYRMRPLVNEMKVIAIDERLKETLMRAIDETVGAKFGIPMRDLLHVELLGKVELQDDELSNSLQTLIPVLEQNFGSRAGQLSRAVGRRLFSHLQLEIHESPQWNLCNYVNTARTALLKQASHEVRP